MKYLFAQPNYLIKFFKNKKIFLFLDYDGTLVTIKKIPSQARITEAVKRIIHSLTKKTNIKICIISGRELNDLKKMVGLKKIIYGGNHGFKISFLNRKIYIKKVRNSIYIKLNELKNIIKKEFGKEKGVLFENKKEIFGLHYRMVPRQKQAVIIEKIKNLIKPYKKFLKLKYGKKVIEIFPDVDINKGRAVKIILKKFNKKRIFYPVYIGDDITDEDAFEALKANGLTVCVGKKKTKAEFYLKNVKEVKKFLKLIEDKYE